MRGAYKLFWDEWEANKIYKYFDLIRYIATNRDEELEGLMYMLDQLELT